MVQILRFSDSGFWMLDPDLKFGWGKFREGIVGGYRLIINVAKDWGNFGLYLWIYSF